MESAIGRKRTLARALILAAATFVAYAPSLSGGFIWDDRQNVWESPTKLDGEGLRRTWTELTSNVQYYPLTHTVLWIERHVWGDWTTGYRVVNVLLHCVAAMFLWGVLGRLGVRGGWWAAMIYALHPVQVESVAWITEIKNCLSGVFFWSSVLAYLMWAERVHERDAVGKRSPAGWRLWALSLLLFGLALLSKTVVSMMPVALLVLLWYRYERPRREAIFGLVPFFVLGAAAALVLSHVESLHVQGNASEFTWTWGQRVIIAGKDVWFYVWTLVRPFGLAFVNPRWAVDTGSLPSFVPAASVVALGVVLYAARRRIGRGAAAAYFFFLAMLLPSLGFIDFYFMRYSFVQDHFQYLACAGPVAVLGWLAAAGRSDGSGSHADAGSRRKLAAIPIAVLVVLGISTLFRSAIYRDEETLWRDTIDKNPEAWLARVHLGYALLQRGRVEQAEEHFRAAIRSSPGSPEAYNDLGLIRYGQGAWDEAAILFRRSLEASPRDLGVVVNLSSALLAAGRTEEALGILLRARDEGADSAALRTNLGVGFANEGRMREAESEFRRAIEIDPRFAGAYRNLAGVMASTGRHEEAARFEAEAGRLQHAEDDRGTVPVP